MATNAWRSGFVKANGIRLHYTRTGSDKPPLVLAHGVTADGLGWTPVADLLQEDYDVVMVDARGHGRSAARTHGYDPVILAGAIAGLGLDRPAILGHLMGAITTLVLAGTDPDLPAAILLEDPPAWWAAPSLSAVAAAERRASRRAGLEAHQRTTPAELVADQRREQPGWSDAELGPGADAKLRVSLNVLDLFVFDPATVDWPKILRRVTCPALLIAADSARGAIVDEQFDPYITEIKAFLAETTG